MNIIEQNKSDLNIFVSLLYKAIYGIKRNKTELNRTQLYTVKLGSIEIRMFLLHDV